MRRAAAAVILAAGLAVAAGGCGVQSTGVNTSKAVPFSVPQESGTPTSAPSEKLYPVELVLFPATNPNAKFVTCYFPRTPVVATDLVTMLAEADEQHCGEGYLTYVTSDMTLERTNTAHAYRIVRPLKALPFALQQMECTMDRYWRDHRDGKEFSTLFELPEGGDTGWQDCLYLLGDSRLDKPTAPGAIAATPQASGGLNTGN